MRGPPRAGYQMQVEVFEGRCRVFEHHYRFEPVKSRDVTCVLQVFKPARDWACLEVERTASVCTPPPCPFTLGDPCKQPATCVQRQVRVTSRCFRCAWLMMLLLWAVLPLFFPSPLLSLVPNLEEAVPGASGNSHAICCNPQAAHSIVMARKDS